MTLADPWISVQLEGGPINRSIAITGSFTEVQLVQRLTARLRDPEQMYSPELRIEHAGAFLRESRPREIALSLLRARRFPRNLGFTYQLDTVLFS